PDCVLGRGGNNRGLPVIEIHRAQRVLVHLPQLALLVIGLVVEGGPVLLVHVEDFVRVAVVLVDRLDVDYVGVAHFPLAHRRTRPTGNRYSRVQNLLQVVAAAGTRGDVGVDNGQHFLFAQVHRIKIPNLKGDAPGVVVLRPIG